jgi:hypothetical protein
MLVMDVVRRSAVTMGNSARVSRVDDDLVGDRSISSSVGDKDPVLDHERD